MLTTAYTTCRLGFSPLSCSLGAYSNCRDHPLFSNARICFFLPAFKEYPLFSPLPMACTVLKPYWIMGVKSLNLLHPSVFPYSTHSNSILWVYWNIVANICAHVCFLVSRVWALFQLFSSNELLMSEFGIAGLGLRSISTKWRITIANYYYLQSKRTGVFHWVAVWDQSRLFFLSLRVPLW